MKNEFVPYEIALQLKELGFDEPCFCVYNREKVLRFNNLNNPKDRNKGIKLTSNNGRYPAPTFSQAFRWFREKYGCEYSIKPVYGEKHYRKYRCNIYCNEKIIHIMKFYFPDNPYFDTYEEAELACLKKLIQIVKNGKE